MDKVHCAAAVGSLMYALTCTRPNISFAVGVFGWYQSDPRWNTKGQLRKLYDISSAQ